MPGNLVYVNGSTWGGILRLWVMHCCNIYADDITLYSKCDQASGLWWKLELVSELESHLWYTVTRGGSGLLILKKLN